MANKKTTTKQEYSEAAKKPTEKKKVAEKTAAARKATPRGIKTKVTRKIAARKTAKNVATASKHIALKRPKHTAEQRIRESNKIACMLAEQDGFAQFGALLARRRITTRGGLRGTAEKS